MLFSVNNNFLYLVQETFLHQNIDIFERALAFLTFPMKSPANSLARFRN